MKTKLLILIGFLSLTFIPYAFGACGVGGGCGIQAESPCECVDPACGSPYSCMGRGYCCAAFGNIGGIDTAEPTERRVYTADEFPDAFVEPVRKHYRHYRPRVYSLKGE